MLPFNLMIVCNIALNFEEGLEHIRELYGAGTSEELTHDSYEARRYVPLSTEDLIILYMKEIEVVTALKNLSVFISDFKVISTDFKETYQRQCHINGHRIQDINMINGPHSRVFLKTIL